MRGVKGGELSNVETATPPRLRQPDATDVLRAVAGSPAGVPEAA